MKNRLSVKLSPAAIPSKFCFWPLNNNKKSFLSFLGFYHPLISKSFLISHVLQFSMCSSEIAPKTWYVPKFKKIEGGDFEKSRFFQTSWHPTGDWSPWRPFSSNGALNSLILIMCIAHCATMKNLNFFNFHWLRVRLSLVAFFSYFSEKFC